LGHEKVLTTFLSYGEVSDHRQGEIMRRLVEPEETAMRNADEIADAIFKWLKSDEIDKKV